MEKEKDIFTELRFMARNEIAMPKIEGMKREFAINQAKLFSRKLVMGTQEHKLLLRRQFHLYKQLSKLEKEKE